MNDLSKTKRQLIEELAAVRQLNAELINSAAENKLLEETIKGSEERYRNLVERAHDVLWVFDLNLGHTYISPSVKRLRGYSVEEAMNQRLDQVLTSESAKKARELFERERLLEINGHHHDPDWSYTTDFEMIHKDGHTFWTEMTMNALYDDAGRIKGIIGTTRDISERKRVEEMLKDSEKRYRLLAENARDVIWVLDENLRYTYVSPSVKKLRGYTPEEVMNQTMDKVLAPDSYQVAMEIFIKEFELEKKGSRHLHDWSMPLELELNCKDGSTVWTEVNISLIYDEADNPTGILGLTRDISARKRAEEELKEHRDNLEYLVNARTAEVMKANKQLKKEIQVRKQTEEALRESTEKYRIYFSLTDDVIFSYDSQYRVLSVSPNVERVLGYKPEDLVGKYFQDLTMLIHPDDLSEALDNALHVLSGKTVYTNIYRFITRDGEVKYGDTNGVPIIRDGRVVAMISMVRDITSRIEIEKSLQESEERYRITLQSMPDAVSIIRIEDTQYLYVNDAFCKITGYTLEEVKGKTPFDLNLPVTTESLDDCLDLIKNHESIDKLEHQCRKRDGGIIDTLISARKIHYDGKDCLIMVIVDITEIKQIVDERKKLEFQYLKMESIGTLASGIAHDFNNILTSIIGYTQMSMKDILSLTKGENNISVVRSDLNEVRNAAHRARDLVNHILAFSRHTEKEYVPIELITTIKESLKVLRQTLPSNIKIHENLIDTHLILGNPAQIHQVLTNLCTNAAHAMDKTGGELEVSLQKVIIDDALNLDVTPGCYLRLSVRDTGLGMTAKVMTRIFDPYFTTKWKGHGTGLGLSIVHGIVKSHGGAISCRTAPGEGTTFDIYLPEYEFSKEEGETKTEITHTIGGKRVLDLDENLTRKESRGKKKEDLDIHGKNKQC
jgi:two-component system, cell cycle sensor histidine kinase and response regulator CckA